MTAAASLRRCVCRHSGRARHTDPESSDVQPIRTQRRGASTAALCACSARTVLQSVRAEPFDTLGTGPSTHERNYRLTSLLSSPNPQAPAIAHLKRKHGVAFWAHRYGNAVEYTHDEKLDLLGPETIRSHCTGISERATGIMRDTGRMPRTTRRAGRIYTYPGRRPAGADRCRRRRDARVGLAFDAQRRPLPRDESRERPAAASISRTPASCRRAKRSRCDDRRLHGRSGSARRARRHRAADAQPGAVLGRVTVVNVRLPARARESRGWR
jgi:hypothetical protein